MAKQERHGRARSLFPNIGLLEKSRERLSLIRLSEIDPRLKPAAARILELGRPPAAAWLLGALGLASIAIALTFGLTGGDLGYELIQRYHVDLIGFAYGRPLLASILFMVVCTLAVAISVPGASLLAVLGGLLFGWFESTLYVVLASLVAGTAVFLLARHVLASAIRSRAGPRLGRLTDGFNRNAFRYVFFMNLMPLLPYGMIIALPAAFGVRLKTFLIAAFLGVLPSTVMLANLGEGLGVAFFREGGVTFFSLLSPQILLAATGLIGLAVLPVVYRRLTRRELT